MSPLFMNIWVMYCSLSSSCHFQLYGEYREHPGGSGRREATRLLTERQWKKHHHHHHGHHPQHHHGHHHHGHHHGHHHSHTHGHRHHSRHRGRHHSDEVGHAQMATEQGNPLSMKKRRSYSKCRGEESVLIKVADVKLTLTVFKLKVS